MIMNRKQSQGSNPAKLPMSPSDVPSVMNTNEL